MPNKWQTQLRKWRKALDVPQKQAADKLGVSLRTYQGWEEGRKGPSGPAMAELQRRIANHTPATLGKYSA